MHLLDSSPKEPLLGRSSQGSPARLSCPLSQLLPEDACSPERGHRGTVFSAPCASSPACSAVGKEVGAQTGLEGNGARPPLLSEAQNCIEGQDASGVVLVVPQGCPVR